MKKSLALRLAAAGSAVAAAAAVGLATAAPASAHYTDSLHQHGWTTPRLTPILRCIPSLFGEAPTVSIDAPNFMTTPGGLRNVYFRAILERYDFSQGTWVAARWNGSRWIFLGVTPWFYSLTNSTGQLAGWRSTETNIVAPYNIALNVEPGFYYRFTMQYHWGYDGTQYSEPTGSCKV